MTIRRAAVTIGALLLVVALATTAFRAGSPRAQQAATLVASIRAEPRSFNRYTARDLSTTVVTYLTQAGLVRVNRSTDRLEGELAERWELLPDQKTYRVTLRPGLTFSDGEPFTADDVAFSFRALYDERGGTALADSVRVSGRPITVTVENTTTVLVRFPAPFAPGLRLLDGIPMLPRHRLESALVNGRFAEAWGVSATPGQVIGLGPFVLTRYAPGQRLAFDRNPHYTSPAGRLGAGAVQHVILDVVPDQDAEQLRLTAGAIDITQSELRPSDWRALREATADRRVRIADAGIGLDGDLLWMNLRRDKAADPRSPWLQHASFRRAIAQAIDLRAFADFVYLGHAVPALGVVSPGNVPWYVDAGGPRFDPDAARASLASLGLTSRTGDSILEDRHGRPVRFTLLTQAGNTSLERGASVIRDALTRLGVAVDVVRLEAGALVHRIESGDYDAIYFRLLTTDADPALNLDFWRSSGGGHVWNPEQSKPATEWEADIDTLIERVAARSNPGERRDAFAAVQRIMARELPAMAFAFPRLSVAIAARVHGASAAAFRPPVLWNPADLAVDDGRR